MAKHVDYRDTLVTYLHCETVESAAKNLKISATTLHGRLRVLRKAGVKVPTKGRKKGLGNIEIAQLNSIVNKYNKENSNAR